jgi:hypothetical protein
VKLVVLTAIVCLAAVGSLSAHAASAGGAPPCTPKLTKIRGHQAAVNCGPATAILHIGGKTYTFRNGFCQKSKAAGTAPELILGTMVLGAKGNAGQPDFSMTITAHRSGTVDANYGGKDLLVDEGLINASGDIPSKGTFTSALGAKFSGSWNCRGVVFQAP